MVDSLAGLEKVHKGLLPLGFELALVALVKCNLIHVYPRIMVHGDKHKTFSHGNVAAGRNEGNIANSFGAGDYYN